jgi:hypothetical protein
MMTIEFALFKLQPELDELEFYEDVMQALEIQDEWVKQHMPHQWERNRNCDRNVSSIYLAKTDPACLLIVAPWNSPEAHQQWIDSEEYQVAMAKIKPYIASDDDALIVFDMDAAGMHHDLPNSFDEMASFDVCRFVVDAPEKSAVQDRYRNLEDELARRNLGDQIWGGWKIAQSGNREEFVVLSSQEKLPLELAAQKSRLCGKSAVQCFHQIC